MNESKNTFRLKGVVTKPRVVYGYRAGNSTRHKTRYDQLINHLRGGADDDIRSGFLSVGDRRADRVLFPALSVLARQQANAGGTQRPHNKASTKTVCRSHTQTGLPAVPAATDL